jgi:hypothetical protein
MPMENTIKALFIVALLFAAFGCSQASKFSALSTKDCASAGGKVVSGANADDLYCPAGKAKIGEVSGATPAICCM